ncbi:hypothetical protein HCH_04113 [Hahella chejuensis KCTC 2396]|uniref:Uncharacterized protein n=1 Tax=Hahella chejuensis (strain KCTC 2396) TaxID=349521 RepID=Q2SEV1_HAHCH|nr:hypothetical protein [Hahella chejuensis]ABC30823.1 hypothetical protein HCH_04113 [Hahella chejuensis KCTC 2396]
MKIGVVGFSKRWFDQEAASSILERAIKSWVKETNKDQVEIVSGLTNAGVPKLAYELAVRMGITTVGISARRALKVRSGIFPCDKQILVGLDFGDESEAFIDYIDCLIRVGGGPQSRKEVELFKERKGLSAEELSSYLYEEEVEWFGKD